jgi:hypothetical protein
MSEPLDLSLDADGAAVIELWPVTRLSALPNQLKKVLDAAVDTNGSSFQVRVGAINLKDEIPCQLDASFGRHPRSWNGLLRAVAGTAQAEFISATSKTNQINIDLTKSLIFGKGTVTLTCSAEFAEPEKLELSNPISFSNPFEIAFTQGAITTTLDMGDCVVRSQILPAGQTLLLGTPIQLKPKVLPEAWKKLKLEMALRISGKTSTYLIDWTPFEKDKSWPPTPYKLGLKPDLHLDPALASSTKDFDLELCLRSSEKNKSPELFSLKLSDPIPKPTLTYGSLYKPVVIAVKLFTPAPQSREETQDRAIILKIGKFYDAPDSVVKIDALLCTSTLCAPPTNQRTYAIRKSSRPLDNASSSNPLALELTGTTKGYENKIVLSKLLDAGSGAEIAYDAIFLMFRTLPMPMKKKDGIKVVPLPGLYNIDFAANAFTPVESGLDKNCYAVTMSDNKVAAATQGLAESGIPVTIFQYIPAPAKPVTEKKAEPKAKDKKAPTTKAKT